LRDIYDLPDNFTQELYKKIGQNVKRIRKQKNISQLKLAHALGHKSVTIVSLAEICHKDKYHFNIEHLSKIAYILDVEISEFFQ
jgi:transcriptional regulator with XRE-family HTH domain